MHRRDNLPPGEDVGGEDLKNAGQLTGRNKNDQSSAADLRRGYSEEDGLIESRGFADFPEDFDPDRHVWDEKSGRYVDRYAGGFLPRDTYSRER